MQRLIPGRPDLGALVASVPTLFWWSTGVSLIRIGFVLFAVFAVVWIGLAIWWLASCPRRVWVPIIGLLVIVSCWQGAFDLGFRAERDCLTATAEAALETVDEADLFRRVSEEGACGFLDFAFVDVVTIPASNDGYSPASRVVVIRDAGAASTNLFGGEASYVYSPSQTPTGCRGALGPDNYSACSVNDLGGGWLRVDAAVASN